jgi:hypothetical protein
MRVSCIEHVVPASLSCNHWAVHVQVHAIASQLGPAQLAAATLARKSDRNLLTSSCSELQ